MSNSCVIVPLDADTYISSFAREREELARVARGRLKVPLLSCPGWTMATLLAHLGGAYAYVAGTIAAGGGAETVQDLEVLGLPSDIERWFREDRAPVHMPSTVVDWFRETGETLECIFRETPLSAAAWSWWGPDQTVGFWLRRMANETAVHRWDAESALGRPKPIEAELARDGIDEMFEIYVPRWCRPKSTEIGHGESYRFERVDGEAAWTVHFEGEGISVDGSPRADVVLRGTASDLLLFLWRRLSPDRLDVEGDTLLIGRYFDFVPPD